MNKKTKNKILKIGLIIAIFASMGLLSNKISLSYYYGFFITPQITEEIELFKSSVSEFTYVPEELKTKNIQDIDYIKETNLTRSAYYTVKDIHLRTKYYNEILRSANKSYLTLNTIKAFVDQHDPNSESYIEGALILPEAKITEATEIINDIENIVENPDGAIQETINKINQGLNEIASFYLGDTSNKNFSYIRKVLKEQDQRILSGLSNNFSLAFSEIRENLKSFITLSKNSLIQP